MCSWIHLQLKETPFYLSIACDILDKLRRELIGESTESYSSEDAGNAEYEGPPKKIRGMGVGIRRILYLDKQRGLSISKPSSFERVSN